MFSISTQFSSIKPIDRTLSGVTNPGKSGHGSDGNKGVLRIPPNSSITADSPDCLVSFPGHSLGESYSSTEVQSVYFAVPADWATRHSLGESYPSAEMQPTEPQDTLWGSLTPLQRCSRLGQQCFLKHSLISVIIFAWGISFAIFWWHDT